MRIKKTLYLVKDDVDRWEKFCLFHFKTKRVLSKIMSEAMEEYIENFEK
jgi:hypothetical protein